MNRLSVIKCNENAVLPKRGTDLSVGVDLTAITLYKQLTEQTALYGTGLKVLPPKGYYIEILPRSSLTKTGYVLSNSVGIIDPDYQGELLIALTKVDNATPKLELPFTRCQLILRKFEEFDIDVVDSFDHVTVRGEGGFGSTDKK